MNRSGAVLSSVFRKSRTDRSDLVVICDNLDLPVGQVRLKRRGESRSHNGIASVMNVLQSGDFLRLYLGIGRPVEESVVDFVLGRPTEDEHLLYEDAVQRAAEAIISMGHSSVDEVMNSLNRRP